MSQTYAHDRLAGWIDAGVGRLGGRAVVASRRGMGYFALEVIPVAVWSQITGAVSGEFFYFIAYLQLLGASNSQLAYLPLTCAAAGVGQLLVVLLRRPGHAKRRCIIECWILRSTWLGTILWPLACLTLGLGVPAMLAGILGCVFVTHLLAATANAGFVSWTQAMVPPPLRGTFYAWRNIASYLTAGLVLGVVALIFPSHAAPHRQLLWLMGLMTVATLCGVASTWLLARAPDVPAAERLPTYGPLATHLSSNAPLRRFLAWSFLSAAAAGVSVVFQSVLFLSCGATPSSMASCQALALFPCMLVAIGAAGWFLPRLHGRRMLVIAHLLTILAETTLLALTTTRLPWLMPIVLGLFGLSKGALSVALIGRIQELIPRGDPRIYALYGGLSSIVALLVTLKLPLMTTQLTAWAALHPTWVSSAPWGMVLVGVVLRIAATPFLLTRDARPIDPQAQGADATAVLSAA